MDGYRFPYNYGNAITTNGLSAMKKNYAASGNTLQITRRNGRTTARTHASQCRGGPMCPPVFIHDNGFGHTHRRAPTSEHNLTTWGRAHTKVRPNCTAPFLITPPSRTLGSTAG